MLKPAVKTRWTYDEYHRMGESGFFRDQRVELIDGKIIEMPPQKDAHAIAVGLVTRALWQIFAPTGWVRSQLPLHLPDDSEPEPDVSVVAGSERDFLGRGHPQSALLIVEISDTSLDFDRREKAGVYARAGIADYWIVNLIDRYVEVYRRPVADAGAPFGYRYADHERRVAGESISPLASAESSIQVDDMLP